MSNAIKFIAIKVISNMRKSIPVLETYYYVYRKTSIIVNRFSPKIGNLNWLPLDIPQGNH